MADIPITSVTNAFGKVYGKPAHSPAQAQNNFASFLNIRSTRSTSLRLKQMLWRKNWPGAKMLIFMK